MGCGVDASGGERHVLRNATGGLSWAHSPLNSLKHEPQGIFGFHFWTTLSWPTSIPFRLIVTALGSDHSH